MVRFAIGMATRRAMAAGGLIALFSTSWFACSGQSSMTHASPEAGEPEAAREAGDGGTRPDGPIPGTVIDAGLYTVTVLGPQSAGSCNVHTQHPSHFTDTTKDWGLAGSAMSNQYAADLDHDGYPDLIMMSGAQDQREQIPTFDGGAFHNEPDGGFNENVAVLMNRPKPGGGRTFVDETAQSGLFRVRGTSKTEYRMTQIVTIGDVDNDGNPDVFCGVVLDGKPATGDYGMDTNELLVNDGRGHFSLAPQSDPSKNVAPAQYQAVFTDIDQDGRLDLLLTYWYDPAHSPYGSQAQLYWGHGDGSFTDITSGAGLETTDYFSISSLLAGTNPRPSFGATACDLNGDGFPELLISAYGGQSNMLYVNDGTGHYKRLIQKGGFDGDLDVDYHDNEEYLCYCAQNPTDVPYCTGAATPTILCPVPAGWNKGIDDQPAMLNGNNFSAACRDVNGDGKPDVFQSTIRHWWAGQSTDPSTLLLNKSNGKSVDLVRVDGATNGIVFPHVDPGGWNEGIQQAALVDMDNDGRVDVLLGGSDYAYQYGHLFIQQPNGSFEDLARQWGMFFPCMDGLTVADLDRDGDLDVIVRGSLYRNCCNASLGAANCPTPGWPALDAGDAGTYPAFAGYSKPEVHVFTNDASQHSRWLEIRLRGNGSDTNTMGIGASVSVTANGVTQVQQMLGAHGIGAESDDPGVLFYGLGDCAGVDKIEVTWPNHSHTMETWKDAPSGHMLELRQGDATLYGVNL